MLFTIVLFTETSIKLVKKLPLHLDATGSVVRKIPGQNRTDLVFLKCSGHEGHFQFQDDCEPYIFSWKSERGLHQNGL